jgi:hypothetical protein
MFILVLGLSVWMTGIAYAQGGNVFVGYSYEQNNVRTGAGLHGYNLAATLNLNSKVGIEANLAGHHGNTTSFERSSPAGAFTDKDDIFTYVFGPKLTHVIGPSNNFEVYGHFLIGGSKIHTSSQASGTFGSFSESQSGTGFTFMTGGGLDWFRGSFGVRILEFDFVRVANIAMETGCGTNCVETSRGDSAANFRFATGVIWRWGRP